jgi:hypothetical protein
MFQSKSNAMKNIFKYSLFLMLLLPLVLSCEKQIDKVKVTYRIINFQDDITVNYKHDSDTLINVKVEGPYTLATPWVFNFQAEPGQVVYVSMTDTVSNSFSRVQILLDGKIYKEKSRTTDRFMPVVVSGVVPFE